ncbi:MAG: hypothetical protein Q9222_004185 [Ikaeria aurantiellina]
MAALLQALTAYHLTTQRLPDIAQNPKKTGHISTSSHAFVGLFTKWVSFEREVRQNTIGQAWSGRTLTYRDGFMDRQAILRSSSPMYNLFQNNFGIEVSMVLQSSQQGADFAEIVRCANETGVVGRFQQQVGHVMSHVGLDLGMHLYFGDWHDKSHLVPDLTIWTDEGDNSVPKVCGEMKTPWTLELGDDMAVDNEDPDRFETVFAARAGQIANYMREHDRKYGFLTTYEDTVFFKQETITFDGALAAAHSSLELPQSHVYYNNEKNWATDVVKNPRARRLGKPQSQVKHAAASSASRSMSTRLSASTSKTPQKQMYPGSVNVLADKMNGLHIEDQKTRMMRLPEHKVHWDRQRKAYICQVNGRWGTVGKSQEIDGVLLVKINDLKYRGILV